MNVISFILLIINVTFLLSITIITIYLIILGNLTFVPFWIYWILISVGIITGTFSFVKKNVPSQMKSAGILLFTGFVSFVSIGMFLLILFVIQLTFSLINWNRYDLEPQ